MTKNARKQLGQNIREHRLTKGWSQEQLAANADLHRTYLGAVERGERNVSLDNIVAIASALKISPSDLMQGIAK